MSTLLVYPDAGTGGTTVDGGVERDGDNAVFSTVRGAVGTGSSPTATAGHIANAKSSATTNQFAGIARGIMLFNTSGLGVVEISSATISLQFVALSNALGEPSLDIVASSPASNGNLVSADYSQLGNTVYGDLPYSSASTGAYNDITLNSSGESAISTSGITKFGTRTGWDTDNSFGGTWVANSLTYFYGYYADQTGTTSDPKLTIEYSEGGAADDALFFGCNF